ncbi:hypothetical protein FQA47_005144 [Oryzias melastigma]|uniref:Uncharacterized protein n=1 Tax=Oryzias melastigma TaxID=30732 RepID=A0A834FE38_ORYME|nr:hypothetical protein FQA47_005144 [Oryzias melastigma]
MLWHQQHALQPATSLNYGCGGDRGSGPVLSGTRGMRQLKEPSRRRTTNKSLVGWELSPHGGTAKEPLTAGGQERCHGNRGAAVGPSAGQQGYCDTGRTPV